MEGYPTIVNPLKEWKGQPITSLVHQSGWGERLLTYTASIIKISWTETYWYKVKHKVPYSLVTNTISKHQ